ncbi:MAG: dioxygenase [Gammaproteobacteria bacterium]|nr:dioxygenase [Gammaproteobacteria bacterium]
MTLAPIMYLPHGGGPMPLLNEPGRLPVSLFLRAVSSVTTKPKAIVIVSANWEEECVSILTPEAAGSSRGSSHNPASAGGIVNSPSPDRLLADTIGGLLSDAGIQHRRVRERGFDHAVIVPMKILYPDDDTPCVQLSLVKGLDPALHIEIGKALSRLRADNVLIIGSGMSFINMQAMQHPETQTAAASFNQWLIDTCCSAEFTLGQREQRLCDWTEAPYARYCHPREEHLMPLHVCMGMTQDSSTPAELVFNETVLGAAVSGVLWQ